MDEFKNKFLADTGARRMINNLVFTTITNFNYLNNNSDSLYNKIIVKGGKALGIVQGNALESFDIDGDLFLSKEKMDEIMPKNVQVVQGTNIFPEIEKYTNPLKTDEEVKEQLDMIGEEIAKKLEEKIKMPEKEYDNSLYRVQLDAIVSKYLSDKCLAQYALYRNNTNTCYDCKIIHKIDSIVIEKTENGQRTQHQVWMFKFTLYFEFKYAHTNFKLEMNETKRFPNSLKIAFFDLTVANPYLQVENYKNRLDIQLSPHFFIIRPTLIINNLIDMASQPSFHKRNSAKTKYEKFIRLPFTNYNCEVIKKLSPVNMQEEQELNNISRRRAQIINNPVALARTEQEMYNKIKNTDDEELNAFIRQKMNGDGNKRNISVLTPIEKENLTKMFIRDKLHKLGLIGNLNKHIQSNVRQVEIKYSEVLAPFKDYLDIFADAHTDYSAEIKNAKNKCAPYKVSDKYLQLKNVVNKNFISKEQKGILTKYIKKTNSCNCVFV